MAWVRTQTKELVNLDRTAHVHIKDTGTATHAHKGKTKESALTAETQGGSSVLLWKGPHEACEEALQMLFNHLYNQASPVVLDLSTFTGSVEKGNEVE